MKAGNIFLIPFCTVFFSLILLTFMTTQEEENTSGFPLQLENKEKTPNPLRKTPFHYFSFPNPTRNSLQLSTGQFQSWLWKMMISSMIYPASKPNQFEKGHLPYRMLILTSQ